MRGIFLGLVLVIGLAGGAVAQSADIEATIGAQIEAFKADDFVAAFGYASPTIRRIFQNPENFGGMVRQGYPMVWRPADVRFLELRETGGRLWQKVMITDHSGAIHILEYQMIHLENGWKINGVQRLGGAGANA